ALRPVDELFDPYRHEAVAQEPAADPLRAGYVVRVLQTGYALHDRLLRPARVSVGV
ncbi:MAG: nucleotide exchange factor GrpE, partial [Betaproteobacteria bacterium]|nr:nucleotide exchange factor GrpE [Betaproteobacteria bacterium]